MTPSRSLPDLVDRLRHRIVEGELEPGSPLRQVRLANEMGVSRIPVRDALLRLEAEGLIEVRSDRGAYVKSLTASGCVEVFDLRVLLECDALAQAIPNHTPRSIRSVEAVQRELEVEDETRLWVQGDRRFHELLYEPSARPRTLQFIEILRNVVDRFYLTRLEHGIRRDPWKKEHHAILDAVLSRDIGRALAALAGHLRATQEVVLAALDRPAGVAADPPRRAARGRRRAGEGQGT